MNRSILLCGLIAALAMVFSIAGSPPVEAWPPYYIHDPNMEYPSCCADFEQLQGQACPPDARVYCNWGYYGEGYCQCYYGTGTSWECYSYQPIPASPDQPICY
jgi:hypothetical protein